HHVCYEIVTIFFFQAEDGIRDLIVTGVQTCALPIYDLAAADRPSGRAGRRRRSRVPRGAAPCRTSGTRSARRFAPAPGRAPRARSEERRVGKECNSRWGRE